MGEEPEGFPPALTAVSRERSFREVWTLLSKGSLGHRGEEGRMHVHVSGVPVTGDSRGASCLDGGERRPLMSLSDPW